MAVVPRAKLMALSARYSRIGGALWWLTMVENSTLTEWGLSLARRSAEQHFAHFLCELLVRLSRVGRAEGNSYPLPLTQEQIADVLGLTPVHVNRTLKRLRDSGLVEMNQERLTILDWNAFKQQAGFDPKYLHAEEVRRTAAAA